MADESKPKSKAPSFYSAAASMDAYSGKGEKNPTPNPGQDSGEKAKSVATLLEVVKKMDGMETDPESKKILQQMVTLAEQYMEKVKPGSKAGAGTTPAASSESGPGATSGATMGDTTGATAVM